jgi:hypothetical protein
MGAKSEELAYAVRVRSKSSMVEPQTFYTLSTYCYQFIAFLETGHITPAVADRIVQLRKRR